MSPFTRAGTVLRTGREMVYTALLRRCESVVRSNTVETTQKHKYVRSQPPRTPDGILAANWQKPAIILQEYTLTTLGVSIHNNEGISVAHLQIGVDDTIDEIIHALDMVLYAFSVIEPDGTAHGWMTTELTFNEDGTRRLWYGLRQEGEKYRFDVPEGQGYQLYAGEANLLNVQTEQEAKCFMLGLLIASTGCNVQEVKEVVQTITETDPYRRWIELHKISHCPIWSSRED